jgi:hypothetical protein
MTFIVLNNVSDIRLKAVWHNSSVTPTGDYESIIVTMLDAKGDEIASVHINPTYGKSEMKVDWESTIDMRRTKEETEALAYVPPF